MTKIIGPLLDKAANDIFLAHKKTLLSEPITYIVPAVWSASKDGKLTAEQENISKQVLPVIKEIFAVMEIGNMTEAQKFAVGFLVRGLIISKITYMIEALKNRLFALNVQNIDNIIHQMKPMGNA
ncbi:MAG: hypothetical protein ACE14T_06010 [Syntrophales bacterium]